MILIDNLNLQVTVSVSLQDTGEFCFVAKLNCRESYEGTWHLHYKFCIYDHKSENEKCDMLKLHSIELWVQGIESEYTHYALPTRH